MNKPSLVTYLLLLMTLLNACQNPNQPMAEPINNIKVLNLNEINTDVYKTIGEGRFYTSKFSPDNKILAVGTSISIIFYDTSNYQKLKTIPSHTEILEWSPDGNKLAALGGSRLFIYDYALDKVIELEDGTEAHGGEQISWSPDGKYIASPVLLMYHSDVWVWDAQTGEKKYELSLKTQFLATTYDHAEGLDWSSDGKKLAVSFRVVNSSNIPSQLTVWDLSRKKPTLVKQWDVPDFMLKNDEIPHSSFGKVYWTSNDKILTVASSNNISILDAYNGKIINKLIFPEIIHDIYIGASTITLISGTKNLTAQTYSFPEFEEVRKIQYTENVFCDSSEIKYNSCHYEFVNLSSDISSSVLGNSSRDEFHVWDLNSNIISKSIFLNSHWNSDLAFSPDSKFVAVLRHDRYVRSYEVENLNLISEIDYAGKLLWSENGELTKAKDQSDDYFILNEKYEQEITSTSPDGKLSAHIEEDVEAECFLFACTPGSKYKLSISLVETNKIIETIGLERPSMEIKWSPDSKWLITTGDPIQDMKTVNFGLIIISTEGIKPILLITNTGSIKGIDWSDNGKLIAATGYNGIIRIFNFDKIITIY